MDLKWTFAGLAFLAAACAGDSEQAGGADTTAQPSNAKAGAQWADTIDGLERREGFITVFVGEKDGRVLAAFPAPDDNGLSLRAIHAAGLTAGLGSNPIGLDRGLFDSGSLIAFRRIGNKLVAEEENWSYRASADNPLERKAVRESFARSFLWSADVLAEGPDGAVLVDFSGFLIRDALNVAGTLKRHPGGGDFKIADDRSFPDVRNVLVFPDNVEFDAFLTLVSSEPKSEVRATAADGRAVTLVQHHSLVRLPAEGFKSRAFDPRTGAIDISYYDFSAPLDAQIKGAFARRFRLEKQDPSAAKSPAKEPLVFYVDSGAPEQVRDALIDGALWWADAFDAAGFPDSYRVEVLPSDVHPRDIRYNTILWTHRQTRGWSYGGGVSDPRTGEMLKASVILGSQRVRQDRMIFEGLAGAEKSGTGAADDPVEIALARIRQLSAHEVGHTLGFAHNFAASSNDRASVMDYPAPLVTVTENRALDFSNAYDVGIGEWDKFTTTWLYAEFPEGADEEAELEVIVREGYASGLRFVGDREGRSVGTGHPFASVWDNGEDAVAMLEETMNVRRIALENFSARSIDEGRPMAALREVIVPIYLYHRYQIDAAAKLVGGYEFSYKAKGDTLPGGTPVADAAQRRALAVLVDTLDPAALVLPDSLLDQLTPPFGTFGALAGGGETFETNSDPAFDLIAAADSAATITMNALLHPARGARLVESQRRNPGALGFDDVLTTIEETVFAEPAQTNQREIAYALQGRFVSSLIDLSLNENATPAVRSRAEARLRAIRVRLGPRLFGAATNRGHNAWLSARIDAHLNRPAEPVTSKAAEPDIPPGSPIGSGFMETCWHCDPIPSGD